MKLVDITELDRSKIDDIFNEDDVYVLNRDWKEEGEGVGYVVVQLENDTDDCFYDHSVPLAKIFKELHCIPTGFGYQNEYGDKNDTNTAYAMWFEKIVCETVDRNCSP